VTDFLIEEEMEGGEMPPSSPLYSLVDFPHLKYDDGGLWRENAYCLGKTRFIPLFFPETGRGNRRKPVVAKAKIICSKCSVRKECFNFAKKNDFEHGVWGGVDFFKPSRPALKEPIPDDVD
jgi:hypothetical protein